MNINEPIQKGISQNTIDDIIDKTQNVVVKEFAEKLKEKALLHCRTINCYECKFIETTIDELLEEYEVEK